VWCCFHSSLRATTVALVLALVACGADGPSTGADAALDLADAALADTGPAAADSGSPLAAPCATDFGRGFTAAFGRLDGTLHALVGPTDRQCRLFNGDHAVVQIDVGGQAHRVVVNVQSDGRNGTDTRLRYAELRHALVGPAWSEGWHPGLSLDYARDLGAHTTAGFAPQDTEALVARIASHLALGARVSAYATSSGGSRADSAHLVHRGSPPLQQDGALVIAPDSADPLYLLFHFDGARF
jgi:hypothetical protein